MWIIFFHYIVLEKAQTGAEVAAAATSWTSSALYWSNQLFKMVKPTFHLKKATFLLNSWFFFLCILKFQMELFNTNKGLVSHLNLRYKKCPCATSRVWLILNISVLKCTSFLGTRLISLGVLHFLVSINSKNANICWWHFHKSEYLSWKWAIFDKIISFWLLIDWRIHRLNH